MDIPFTNDPKSVTDRAVAVKCPHCGIQSNLTAMSIPRHEQLARYRPNRVGVAYRCDSCNEPVFVTFGGISYSNVTNTAGSVVRITGEPVEVQRPEETFEPQYLPATVAADFREALVCYSHSCPNAFGAMCRRCIQSAATALGVEGTTKVQNQLQDLRETGVVDDETFDLLRQVMLSGHDGAHPHLPTLSAERAAILLELMRDVLYQLFVLQAKIKEVATLRAAAAQARSAP